MELVVFIPGIMGSELIHANAGKIWPAPLARVLLPYQHEQELNQVDLRVGDIIRRVGPLHQYDLLIEDFTRLGFHSERLEVFPYDWRRDNAQTARALGQRLRELVERHGPRLDISLIGHSMGGLVARYFLEADTDVDTELDPSARPHVKRLITLGTPHRGAPLAFAGALGLERRGFLNPDQVHRLTSNVNFPALYQLMPSPGEAFAWSGALDSRQQLLDIYAPDLAEALGLVRANLESGQRFHAQLDPTRGPVHTRYFAFYGTRHKTVSHVQLVPDGPGYRVRQQAFDDAGDGTVPVWSGLLSRVQGLPVGAGHSRIFTDRRLRPTLGALLGRPDTLDALVPRTQLCVAEDVVEAGRTKLRANLSVERPLQQLRGRLWWERTGVTEHEPDVQPQYERVPGPELELAYAGPAITSLAIELELPQTPGCYRVCFGDDVHQRRASDELLIQAGVDS